MSRFWSSGTLLKSLTRTLRVLYGLTGLFWVIRTALDIELWEVFFHECGSNYTMACWDYSADFQNNWFQGKATGFKPALQLRSVLQRGLYWWGQVVQKHCNGVLIVGGLVLFIFCMGLSRAYIQTNLEKLWVEREFQCSQNVTTYFFDS